MTIDQALELGLEHHRAGRLHDAELVYRQILQQIPSHADALHLLGLIAQAVGHYDDAEQLIRQAIAANPTKATFYSNLGELLRMSAKFDDAVAMARRATELAPNDAEVWHNFGVACLSLKCIEEAHGAFQKATELDPGLAGAWNNLGACHQSMKQASDAAASFRRALAITPNDASVRQNLGVALCEQGQVEEGIAEIRKALAIQPRADWHSRLLYTLLHHPSGDMSDIFAQHLDWARRYAEPITAATRASLARSKKETVETATPRRLRIGYVSPSFRRHAVAFFSEPMLAAHDHTQFEVICYSDEHNADEVTGRFRSYADHWRDIRQIDDERLAHIIREDKIDILVDLTGHIPMNRLLAFARKPAPVQVTYLGYQATTGMTAMDYRLTDGFADPAGTDEFYVEKLVRLPLFFVYRALDDSPAVNELPALKNNHITFGSMNAFVKVNQQVIATWAELLKRAADSRLLILLPNGEIGNQHIREQFMQNGIATDRIELVPRTGNQEYLQLYRRIDIALDPFPFGGHTTTCDALWMGVPTVVLAGKHYFSRMGVSVMNAIQRPDWVAASREEYLDKLIALANDIRGLSNLRARLRDELQNSPAMNASRFTRALEQAYHDMWRQYVSSAHSE